MSVQLAAFNFIPAKFQSRPSLRPLTFGARANTLPHLLLPFPGLLVETALVLLFSTLVDRAFGMYSGNTSKKSKKAAIFCLNISLTKSIDHPWVSWERGGVRWRGMFYPLITPTFTPSSLSVVVLLLVALLLYSLESYWDWSYFMLRLPGPQFENSCVSFHTLLSYGKEHCRVLPFTFFFEGILWGILHLVTNRSRKDVCLF